MRMATRWPVQPRQLGHFAPAAALERRGVFFRQRNAIAHAAQRQPQHATRRVGGDGQRGWQPAGADLFGQRGGGHGLGLQFHQRQALRHGRRQLAQAQEVRLFAGHAQFHDPMQAALQLLCFGLELRAQHQQRLRRGQQHLARLGQRQSAATAVEQGHAQALFQRLDLRGHGGLGQGQRFGRLGQVAQPGNRDESADLIDFHGGKFRPPAAVPGWAPVQWKPARRQERATAPQDATGRPSGAVHRSAPDSA
ncbi:hypothetical protein D3C85_494970 [compost metagenome]